MSFLSFGLNETIMRGVTFSGYTTPTEIQRKAIPLVLQGKDIIGCAPTGTGKTAAFVLPILHRLQEQQPAHNRRHPEPRALILTPTRELAQQIEDAIRVYGKHTPFKPVSIYGGVNINGQFTRLRRGVDIIVATPGRLLDHMERGSIDLSTIEILVLDEADRMYDMGFIRDVRRIVSQVPKERQTMLFSATMSREIRSLVAEILKSPHLIEVGVPCRPVESVTQHFYTISQQQKTELLLTILQQEEVETMLVFSRTKHGADKIARQLERRGVSTSTIHSNRSQSQRQAALEGFKRREFKVLVATDLAARGIDVDGISHVVNYDTPAFPEDYIHRIGRTGRAEASGLALTFVSRDEESHLRKIEQLTGKRLVLKRYPGFAYPENELTEPGAEAANPARERKIRNFQRRMRSVRFA
jgi:ATP-dependent RNA helicase RhlE